MPYDYQTSLPAYNEAKKDIACCQEIVLSVIKCYGPMTDKMIAKHLGWEINRITNRRGELVELGKVLSAYKYPDPVSNRNVNWWKVKEVVQVRQAELFN